MLLFSALRDRYLADRGAGGASPAIAAALTAIGWRAVREPTPEELAGHVVDLIAECVAEHHDTARLTWQVAALLRAYGPVLDGGLPPVEAYEPAALDVLQRYVRGADD
ncbi:hypothetical protein [Roseisolibacter sp. H3M3-2]|uniref:hypothetical protein n=1 Tax=Roseisolibacter sp. H3M3-2 TaxID=3031323 RepID=UPI0023DA40AD|nr:hypothetical protein [Roseisolibacter sp. H3M3-2]MDF1504855.1 hypothetical protein [Roseisolibacter sp. H3M3-2]